MSIPDTCRYCSVECEKKVEPRKETVIQPAEPPEVVRLHKCHCGSTVELVQGRYKPLLSGNCPGCNGKVMYNPTDEDVEFRYQEPAVQKNG